MKLIFNKHNQLTLIYDTCHPPSEVLEYNNLVNMFPDFHEEIIKEIYKICAYDRDYDCWFESRFNKIKTEDFNNLNDFFIEKYEQQQIILKLINKKF